MKTIKRAVIAAAITAAASSAAFALDFSGDAQLRLGWQGSTTKTASGTEMGEDEYGDPAPYLYPSITYQSNAFYIGAANWNLFGLNSMFSVGFFEEVDFGIGGGKKAKLGASSDPEEKSGKQDYNYRRISVNFLIGPAVGIAAGDLAKFQLGVGFAGGYEGLRHKDKAYGNTTISGGMAGFGLDLQAKLLPHSMVSPLVGFQYTYRTMGKYKEKTKGEKSETVKDDFTAHSYTVYVGASYNFGIR